MQIILILTELDLKSMNLMHMIFFTAMSNVIVVPSV